MLFIALSYAQDIELNGTISAQSNQIKNVADPTEAQDAATKVYVDGVVITTQQANAILANTAKVGMPDGIQVGQMNYWDGNTWQTINPGNSGAFLKMVGSTPTWIDLVPPVITVTNGIDTVERGSTWTDAGATADGGELVAVSGTVNTNIVGTYTITYTATDVSGNTATATRTVTVVDTTAPVITVTNGIDTVERGSTWTDAGATTDGGEFVTVSGTVNTNILGTYAITYTATDVSGNVGTVTRTVTVVDTTAPVITVISGTDTVAQGSTWTDAGATADGGELVTVSGTVNTNILGTYMITYTATDASGNVGTATRTVTVYSLSIGDLHQGGYIFYLDGNGGGLIAADTTDQLTAPWGCNGTGFGIGINDGADQIGTGYQNTSTIVERCLSMDTAADRCNDLTIAGYNDWFLPSREELYLMHQNIGQGAASELENVGGFTDNPYWSSTEKGHDGAWLLNFSTETWSGPSKNITFRYRAVRAF